MNFLYSVTLKSIGILTSCIRHLKDINSLTYVYLPNIDKFHYLTLKNHIC